MSNAKFSKHFHFNKKSRLNIQYYNDHYLRCTAIYCNEMRQKDYRTEKVKEFQMASLSFEVIHVLVFCAFILISASSQSHPHQPEKHAALFVFGDSLYDAGNNNYINTTTNYRSNFLPYGETFFGFPTGRVSDGRLIPDFIGKRVVFYAVIFSI